MPTPATIHLRHASWLQFPPDWHMAPHAHPYHELIVVHAGAMEARVGTGGLVTAQVGQTLLYRSGLPHEERSVGGTSLRMVCISFTGSFGSADDDDVLVHDALGRGRSLSAWMSEFYGDLRPTIGLDARDALLVALLSDREMARRPGMGLVQLVRAHVGSHLNERLTLARLARLASLSPCHFARQFRTTAGVPPMEFVRRMRVEAVRSLLSNPSLPLRTIARLVGFRDEFQLSRVYKCVTGSSPRPRPHVSATRHTRHT